MRERFEYEERTEHKGVPPAKERIKMYKTKNLLRKFDGKPPIAAKPPTALPGSRGLVRMMLGAQSVGA